MTIATTIRRAADRVLRPHRRHLCADSSRFNPDVITHTRFWRNGPQLEALASTVFPVLGPSLRRPIRVAVHAGSIGCEAISILMAAKHFGFPDPIDVTSVDIDPNAIRIAYGRDYHAVHLTDPVDATRRLMPDVVNRRFVREKDGRVEIDPSLTDSIIFDRCDMTDATQVGELGPFDVITCQNVLVHLTPEASRIAVQNLMNSLTEHGLLALGGTPPATLSDLCATLGLHPVSLTDRAVYDAWSGRQAIHAKAPRCHLGLEPYDPMRTDAAIRYGHLFARPAAADWWRQNLHRSPALAA